MGIRVYAFSVLLLVACLLAVTAQTPPPKPGPEHQKLAVLLGNWNVEGDIKATTFGPVGKWTSVERTQWMPGGFTVQENVDGRDPSGEVKGTRIYSYDPLAKKHTVHIFFSNGSVGSYTATITGNTWAWDGHGYLGGGKAYYERCNSTFAANGQSYTVRCDTSSDGKSYTPSFEGRATKSR